MEGIPQKSHDQAIDILRGLAILSVVLVHTTTKILDASGNNLLDFSRTLLLNQVARFAVPLFFMVSGFVLELAYPGDINVSQFLKKRLSKIALPYFFWSLIYFYFIYPLHSPNIFIDLLIGTASYQLYFIPTIFIYYCLFPLLHKYYRNIAKFWVLISLCLIQMVLLYVDYYVKPFKFGDLGNALIMNFYIFILGIVAAHFRSQIILFYSRWKILLTLAAVSTAEFIYHEGERRYLASHNYLAYYSQWRPDILIYTLIVAWLLYGFFSSSKRSFKFFRFLSRYSFFVFFSHVATLEIIWHFAKPFYSFPFFDLGLFLAVSGVSLLVAFLVGKIRHSASITG